MFLESFRYLETVRSFSMDVRETGLFVRNSGANFWI